MDRNDADDAQDGPDPLEAIYDLLDRGDAEEALRKTRETLLAEGDDDPVLHFLSGVALLELDRPGDATTALRRAVDRDPEDPEFRSNLALALFRSGEFDAAGEHAETALRHDPRSPDAIQIRALVVERSGDFAEADRLLLEAAAIDPDAFPAPNRLSTAGFEAELVAAAERLPESFRRHLDDVAVTVEPVPSDEVLMEDGAPLDPELLGLFVGASLPDRGVLTTGGELPARILVFQRNLERHFPETDRLRDEIVRTLYHELGHYLGLDEDELAAIDLD